VEEFKTPYEEQHKLGGTHPVIILSLKFNLSMVFYAGKGSEVFWLFCGADLHGLGK